MLSTESSSMSSIMISNYEDGEFSSSLFATVNFGLAAQMNNDGVTALFHGNEDKALELFTSSIRLMKSELTKSRHVDSAKTCAEADMMAVDDNHQFKSSSSSSSSPSGFIPIKMVPLPSSLSTKDFSDDDVLQDLMFNQAIVIPDNACEHTADVDIHIYSAVVIFNLALAHQQKAQSMRGQQTATSDYTTNMIKAEKLYQVILKLLIADHIVCRSPTGIVVMLAAINNLSSLRLLCTTVGGSTCTCTTDGYEQVEQIQNTLGMFVSRNSTVLRDFMEHEPTIQELLVNVLFYKAPKIAAAA